MYLGIRASKEVVARNACVIDVKLGTILELPVLGE